MKQDYPLLPVSKFMFTAAAQTTVCPRCSAKPGYKCRAPSGRRCDSPHGERIHAYSNSVNADTLRQRHTVRAKRLSEILGFEGSL